MNKALKDTQIREFAEDDLKWLWAAYRKGGFSEYMPDDLDQDEFREVAWNVLTLADSLHMGWRNGRARGLFSAREDRGRWEPHVDWFPWASDRDKLECVVSYLHVRRQTDKMIIYSRKPDEWFFKRASMYGVIRRVGDFNSFFERGDTVAVWESKNAWDR